MSAAFLLVAVAVIGAAAAFGAGWSPRALTRLWERRPRRDVSLPAPGRGAGATPDAARGYVRIDVTGGSPALLIDGDAAGSGSRVVAVAPGVHRVEVSAAGETYSPVSALVTVTVGDTSTATFVRQP